MVDTEEAEFCGDCGEQKMKRIGDINQTRLYVCLECFSERHEFIGIDNCDHEYDDKSGNKCIHCGKESVHYK